MTDGVVTMEAVTTRASGSPVRAGENHARFEPGAGSAGGALRTGAGFAAGRMRDRSAAHQSACRRRSNGWARRCSRSTATSRREAPHGLQGAAFTFDRITSRAPKIC